MSVCLAARSRAEPRPSRYGPPLSRSLPSHHRPRGTSFLRKVFTSHPLISQIPPASGSILPPSAGRCPVGFLCCAHLEHPGPSKGTGAVAERAPWGFKEPGAGSCSGGWDSGRQTGEVPASSWEDGRQTVRNKPICQKCTTGEALRACGSGGGGGPEDSL